MKVGVITQHRILNWGSFLQAYATQIFFEKQPGVECEIIDYIYPNKFHRRGDGIPKTFKSVIIDIANKLKLSNIQRKRDRLDEAIHACLHLSDKFDEYDSLQDNAPVYNLYVTGSDQTLNPKFTFGDTNFLFAWVRNPEARIISFAASMPGEKFSPEYENIYKKYLSRYEAISVREQNCVSYLKQLTGNNVISHIDPTLLLSGAEWLLALSKLKRYRIPKFKYILLYKINHTFDSAPYIFELVKQLQEKTGLKVVSLGESMPKSYRILGRTIKDAGPRDFVEIFANAEYVVTNSFHGTAFAINFGRPLYCIIPKETSDDSRQISLIKLCGIENCLAIYGTKLDFINPMYDINKTHDALTEKRIEMESFIKTYTQS